MWQSLSNGGHFLKLSLRKVSTFEELLVFFFKNKILNFFIRGLLLSWLALG